MLRLSPDLRRRAAQIKLLILDVDGVLTDGRLRYGADGELLKEFDAKDGLGIRLLLDNGIGVALITARKAPALEKRVRDLKIPHAYFGREDKLAALDELLGKLDLCPEAVAYCGDDLLDLPIHRRVGLAITPADGHWMVQEEVDWITQNDGGRGAVREIADCLLEARGQLRFAADALLAARIKTPRFHIVIPARYASSRLPAKALADLGGKPMVVRSWENAIASGAATVIVATDDERIQQAVEDAGGQAMMTDPDHPSGTDRLAEVATRMKWKPQDIVVNLQGDEPLVPKELPARLALALEQNRGAGIATMATPIRDANQVHEASIVKVVTDAHGYALYFSRSAIPFVRESEDAENASFLRHLGLYAYRVQTLKDIASLPGAALENAEKLEQLRALAAGHRIHVTTLEDAPPVGVDTPEDLTRVQAIFEGR